MLEASDVDLLSGRSVIVTGAGRGLGAAFARHAAACGANVIVDDIDLDEAESVAASVRDDGGSAIASGISVADPDGGKALADLAMERFGRIDGLINNAAVFYIRSVWEEDAAELERLIGINLTGAINCASAVSAHMRKVGRGSIVNVASSAAFGLAGRGAYGATKAALLSLTYSWALELCEYGVRVNALGPRAATRMNMKTDETVEQVAPVATYLLSDLSSEVNGQCIRACGMDVAWTLPFRYAGMTARTTIGVAEVHDALGRAEAGAQPFGLQL